MDIDFDITESLNKHFVYMYNTNLDININADVYLGVDYIEYRYRF